MQFSDTSNGTGIVEMFRDLTGLDTNAFSLKKATNFVNRAYYDAVLEAWRASGDWDFDDVNQSNFPIATTTMVESQEDYTIPSNALKVTRLEVKDASGNWSVVRPFDETQLESKALSEFMETDGLPKFYRLLRGSIVLYPAPAATHATLTDGLRLYFLREIDEFASTDTTQEPGLPEPFHDILAFGAAYMVAIAKGLGNKNDLKAVHDEKMDRMKIFFADRHKNFKPRIRPRVENYA